MYFLAAESGLNMLQKTEVPMYYMSITNNCYLRIVVLCISLFSELMCAYQMCQWLSDRSDTNPMVSNCVHLVMDKLHFSSSSAQQFSETCPICSDCIFIAMFNTISYSLISNKF